MPDPFSVTAPSPGQVFTSQGTIPVSWTPAGSVDVNFATTCTTANGSIFRSVTFTSANTGTMSVPVASVLPTESYNTAQACICNVEVSRTAYGTLDPNYGEGGTIKGVQARTVSITLQ
jgi:hypothetical protein